MGNAETGAPRAALLWMIRYCILKGWIGDYARERISFEHYIASGVVEERMAWTA